MNKVVQKIFPSKEMRAFNKMHRRHRKELIKLAKETNEYDYYWLHQSVIMHIKHLHEYYVACNNVHQSEESRLEIVEQLEYILDLVRELEKTEDDNCGLKLICDDKGSLIESFVPDDYHERVLDQEERVNRLYEEIYSSIGKNIRYWWD